LGRSTYCDLFETGSKTGSPVKYAVKTMSVKKDPVLSLGGFKVLPDHDINSLPDHYAGTLRPSDKMEFISL